MFCRLKSAIYFYKNEKQNLNLLWRKTYLTFKNIYFSSIYIKSPQKNLFILRATYKTTTYNWGNLKHG